MTEETKAITPGHPEYESRMAALREVNKEIAEKMESWSDLYEFLLDRSTAFTSDPSRPAAFEAVSFLQAFVLALRELPEEGDVVVIAKKMNELIILRPDLTNIDACVGEEAQKRRANDMLEQVAGLASVLGAISDMVEARGEEEDELPAPVAEKGHKKVLH